MIRLQSTFVHVYIIMYYVHSYFSCIDHPIKKEIGYYIFYVTIKKEIGYYIFYVTIS